MADVLLSLKHAVVHPHQVSSSLACPTTPCSIPTMSATNSGYLLTSDATCPPLSPPMSGLDLPSSVLGDSFEDGLIDGPRGVTSFSLSCLVSPVHSQSSPSPLVPACSPPIFTQLTSTPPPVESASLQLRTYSPSLVDLDPVQRRSYTPSQVDIDHQLQSSYSPRQIETEADLQKSYSSNQFDTVQQHNRSFSPLQERSYSPNHVDSATHEQRSFSPSVVESDAQEFRVYSPNQVVSCNHPSLSPSDILNHPSSSHAATQNSLPTTQSYPQIPLSITLPDYNAQSSAFTPVAPLPSFVHPRHSSAQYNNSSNLGMPCEDALTVSKIHNDPFSHQSSCNPEVDGIDCTNNLDLAQQSSSGSLFPHLDHFSSTSTSGEHWKYESVRGSAIESHIITPLAAVPAPEDEPQSDFFTSNFEHNPLYSSATSTVAPRFGLNDHGLSSIGSCMPQIIPSTTLLTPLEHEDVGAAGNDSFPNGLIPQTFSSSQPGEEVRLAAKHNRIQRF